MGALVVGVGLLLSSSAWGQAPMTDAEKQGKAKFEAGREAVGQGHLKEALALFQESWALNKVAGTLLNIASCEEQLGLPASAWKHYKEAASMLPATDKRVSAVRAAAAAVEPRVPKLRIRVEAGTPKDAKVMLGDKAIGAGELDTELPLDPGKYTIRVSAAGFLSRSYDVTLKPGEVAETQTVVVGVGAPEGVGPKKEVGPVPAATATGSGTVPDSRGPNKAILIGGGVAAGVAVLAGAVFAGLSSAKGAEAQRVGAPLGHGECAKPGASVDCDKLTSTLSEQNALGAASIWSFVGGGVLGAATLGYWLFAPKGATGALPVKAGAVVTSRGGTLVLEARW